MPDVTAMVPDLETGNKVSKVNVSKGKNVVVPQYYIFIMTDTQ
jgi:hypothetical protein